MNIAFVGNFAIKKGSSTFKDIVMNFKSKHNWYIFGHIGDSDSYEIVKSYIKLSQSYEDGQLQLLLKRHKIDLGLVLSIWPETFSKTFFETIASQIPCITNKSSFPHYLLKDYPLFFDTNKAVSDCINLIESIDHSSRQQLAIYCQDFKDNYKQPFRDSMQKKFTLIK